MRFSKSVIPIAAVGATLALFGIPAPNGSSSQISFASSASARTPCGGEGQRACKVWERPGRPCNKGLVERSTNYADINAGRCVRPSSANRGTVVDTVRDAGNTVIRGASDAATKGQLPVLALNAERQYGPLARRINTMWLSCATPLRSYRSAQSQRFVDEVSQLPCFRETMSLARDSGFRTVTVGLYSEAAIGVGQQVEYGVAFDVGGRFQPTNYYTKANEYLSLGGGAGATIGLFKGTNQPGRGGFGGRANGFSGSLSTVSGGTLATWFTPSGFTGLSVSVGAGLGVDVAYVDSTTTVSGGQYAERDSAPRGVARNGGSYSSARGGDTTLRLCNRSNDSVIHAAFAYYDWGEFDGRANWTAAGWWSVKRGKCENVRLPDDENGEPYWGQVYLMGAGSNGGFWGDGEFGFCVHPYDRFHIAAADLVQCRSDDVYVASEFLIAAGQVNTWNFRK